MRRILSLVLAALLAVGVGTAIVASVKERVDATKLAARHLEVRTTPGNGYDGQWFLGLAYDPLLGQRLASSFDMPRYRAGRPLQAFAGWLLAGGQSNAIPLALLAVGPLALALGSAATGRLLAAGGRSPWWGMGFTLVPGVVVGVTFATAEPLALALAALGLTLVLDGRLVAAGGAFAGAALTKETYLVFAVAAAAWLALGGQGSRRRGSPRWPSWSPPGPYCWGCGGRMWPGGSRPAWATATPPARSGRPWPAGPMPWAWLSGAATCPTPRSGGLPGPAGRVAGGRGGRGHGRRAPRHPGRPDRPAAGTVRAGALRRAVEPLPVEHAGPRAHHARRWPGRRRPGDDHRRRGSRE